MYPYHIYQRLFCIVSATAIFSDLRHRSSLCWHVCYAMILDTPSVHAASLVVTLFVLVVLHHSCVTLFAHMQVIMKALFNIYLQRKMAIFEYMEATVSVFVRKMSVFIRKMSVFIYYVSISKGLKAGNPRCSVNCFSTQKLRTSSRKSAKYVSAASVLHENKSMRA